MTYIYIVCSAVYATLSFIIAIQAPRRANIALAACCGITAVWAAGGATWASQTLAGPVGLLDVIRLLTWYYYLLYLYNKSGVATTRQINGFGTVGAAAFVTASIGMIATVGSLSYTLFSWPIILRLLLGVCELLLIENLYFNLPDRARWHVALPCILLGALACFDILVVADTALFRRPSVPLTSARVIAMIIVAPLLVLAAFRDRRWSEPVRLSRAAVFHSATLVLSGSVLLSLALAGEVLRNFNATWGWIAELSLVFMGLICILLFVSSRSAKSLMDRMVMYHFFADRYDYRTQWLSCISTLSGRGSTERSGLHTRAIRAVADVVDSPSGTLFLKDSVSGWMVWASSWNTPSTKHFSPSHPLIEKLLDQQHQVVDLGQSMLDIVQEEPLGRLGPVWLAIPLLHSDGMIGIVVVGPPRVPFRTDQEVFDLLGILGQEVGTYIAEQQATEAVYQTRSLHDYGKRFAFVAHDIKNVSSQLALLLSNAERYLGNPDFQRDMLATVRSSVEKIDRLLNRLNHPPTQSRFEPIDPVSRLSSLVGDYRTAQGVQLTFEYDSTPSWISMAPEAFDTAITHLINNAVEASPTQPVLLRATSDIQRVVVDITDHGRGMSPEFVRDELFSPLKTKRVGGSGIGAFQARELIAEAGGELLVLSEQGVGTTMRVLFPNAGEIGSRSPGHLSLKATGDVSGR